MKVETINKILGGAVLLAAVLLGFYASLAYAQNQNLGGNAFDIKTKFFLSAGSGVSTDAGELSATTTKVYLNVGDAASSTIRGFLGRGDQLDMNLRARASSSASTLIYAIDVSDNGLDWYSLEEVATTTSGYRYSGIGESRHFWNMSTSTSPICGTNEICRHIVLPGSYSFYGQFFRIRFGVEGNNAAVYGYAFAHEPVQN